MSLGWLLEDIGSGFVQLFVWPTFPLMILGILIGLVVGLVPGIGGTVALVLMLPFIFAMEPLAGFAFLLGMFAVVSTSSGITSILFGVPGVGTAAAVIMDGRPMALNGQPGRALGAVLTSSFMGAIVGALVLMISIPIIRPIVLAFRSPEILALALFGLAFVSIMTGESQLRGLISGALGLLLATVGLDPLTGTARYTFGQLELWDGIGIVPVTIGLFAVPEIVKLWVTGHSVGGHQTRKLTGVLDGVKDAWHHKALVIRCGLIGTGIGMLPGMGSELSQWLAYSHSIQSSSDKSRFGKGDVRGVLGAGAPNDASVSGGLVPTIAFGIPGTIPMAILLGAFLILGVQPGRSMLDENLSLTFGIVWIVIISNVIGVLLCFLAIRYLARIAMVDSGILVPILVMLVLIGSYATRNSLAPVLLTLIFGAVGLLFVYLDWPRPPMILGLILGPIIERQLYTTISAYGTSFLQRPLFVGIVIFGLMVVSKPIWAPRIARRTRQPDKEEIG